jgi:hypothetical protein
MMARRDLGWFLICAGLILLAGRLVTSQAGAVLAALAIGAALWKLFDYRDRH